MGNEVSVSKAKFSVAISTPSIQKLINDTLGDPKRAQRFTASISSVVAANPALQECEAFTVINSALVGEALELPPSPQLGYFYMVPFNDNANKRKVATFILGYKGYIQLAIRSGLYKDIDAFEVKEGEYMGRDHETGKPLFSFLQNDKEREKRNTIGYAAYLELTTGFKKIIYWDYDKMLTHADRYSKAFSMVSYDLLQEGKIPEKDKYKYSSFWYKDFDGMAKKTMLRQLISKWGIMSVEFQNAFENDSTYEDEGGKHFADPESENNKTIEDSKDSVEKESGAHEAEIIEEPQQDTPQEQPESDLQSGSQVRMDFGDK